MKARFTNVGHLMGSAAIEVWITEEDKTVRVAFSGDLGRGDRPILNDPDIVEGADYLVMESTYGDRNHEVTLSLIHISKHRSPPASASWSRWSIACSSCPAPLP